MLLKYKQSLLAWWLTATRPEVVRRSWRVAAVVGTLLLLVNHYDRLPDIHLSAKDAVKAVLSYCIPYCVSTWASVASILERRHAAEAMRAE